MIMSLRLVLLFGLLFLAIASVFFAVSVQEENAEDTSDSYRNELQIVLEQEGSAAAQAAFMKMEEENQNRQLFHILAHWLGAQYYLKEGKEGIRFCDEIAGFGCFHGFYGMAFAAEQDAFLEHAAAFCGQGEDRIRFAECIHGVGHGVLVNIGYEEALLPQALAACSQMGLDFFHERFCTSGVFMEYNLRSLQEVVHGGTQVRSFDASRPYEPCPGLEYPYGIPCYHDLPYWWVAALGPDPALLGKMCQEVANEEYRESCFRGIGKIMPWTVKYQQRDVAQACGAMPSEEALTLCAEEALYVLLYKGEEGAEGFCGLFQPLMEERCLTKAQAFSCKILEEC